jgi:hypothetical protein
MMSVQQHKNWANNCNSEQKPFYYPWEAAVRWCELTNKEAVIMANLEGANNMPSRAIIAQLSAPCLLTRAQAIHHALENQKMPWCRDGKLCDPKDKPAGARLSVLHEDLKKWIAENYPDQKPKFLFDELERSTHSAITLEAYQTLEAENKRLEIENKDTRDRLEKGRGFYAELQRQLIEANARIAELEAAQSNDTKQPIQQQREQALLFWVEGMGRDTVMTMTKPQIQDALKRIDPIFHFSDFDKFWQKQQVIKLEAGKPTRNIG